MATGFDYGHGGKNVDWLGVGLGGLVKLEANDDGLEPNDNWLVEVRRQLNINPGKGKLKEAGARDVMALATQQQAAGTSGQRLVVRPVEVAAHGVRGAELGRNGNTKNYFLRAAYRKRSDLKCEVKQRESPVYVRRHRDFL